MTETPPPPTTPTPLTADEVARAVVEAFFGPLTAVEDDTVTLYTGLEGCVELPFGPVTAVSAVAFLDGTALAEGSWLAQGSRLRWLPRRTWVRVTYDHGWAELPAVVRAVQQAVALRWTQSGGADIRLETIGTYSVQYATTGLALTAAEQALLRTVPGCRPAATTLSTASHLGD